MAFDERFAKRSPGVQLLHGVVEHLSRDGSSVLDSCADPGNGVVNGLLPDRVRLQTVVAVRRSAASTPTYAKWRATAAAMPLVQRARASLRRVGTHVRQQSRAGDDGHVAR
jgi:hypothetical protein